MSRPVLRSDRGPATESVSIVSNRPSFTSVTVMYVVIAVIAMGTAAAVFFLLFRREAELIKADNGGLVCDTQPET